MEVCSKKYPTLRLDRGEKRLPKTVRSNHTTPLFSQRLALISMLNSVTLLNRSHTHIYIYIHIYANTSAKKVIKPLSTLMLKMKRRMLSFSIHETSPTIMHLTAYFENGQRVQFTGDNTADIAVHSRDTLMVFFKLYVVDHFAKTLLCNETSSYYI